MRNLGGGGLTETRRTCKLFVCYRFILTETKAQEHLVLGVDCNKIADDEYAEKGSTTPRSK